MSIDIKLAFDILAFTSVMVLIVLGLGVIASMMGIFNFAHGEFVLLGAYTVYLFDEQRAVRLGRHRGGARRAGAGRPGARARGDPPILRRTHHRHAGHLCDRAGHPRDRARAARRPLQVDLRADPRRLLRRSASISRCGAPSLSCSRIVVIAGELAVPRPHLDRPAHPRLARESRCSRAPAASRRRGSTPSPSPSARRWPASPAR